MWYDFERHNNHIFVGTWYKTFSYGAYYAQVFVTKMVNVSDGDIWWSKWTGYVCSVTERNGLYSRREAIDDKDIKC